MSQALKPYRAVPPGHLISRELEARGWTQKDLAAIMNRPEQAISEIIHGEKQITAETARQLASALGTSAEIWMNMEANYRLHLAEQKEKEGLIERRARVYALAPIAELVKRGWITLGQTIDDLERSICTFLEIPSTDATPVLAANFRQSPDREPASPSQIAWAKRVQHLATRQAVAWFNRERLNQAIPDILAYAERAEDVAQLPAALAALGVHFVIVQRLDKTYLDGAALYIGQSPVVALTLRYDRIDAFWFTLMHELAHIVLGHQGVHLDQLYDDSSDRDTVDQKEQAASQQARDWLIDASAFQSLEGLARVRHFSRALVEGFAGCYHRHPGIVVGRLHHEGLLPYKNLRAALVDVRPYLADWIDVAAPRPAENAA